MKKNNKNESEKETDNKNVNMKYNGKEIDETEEN